MKKNRFNFDKKILEMLDNLDLIPKTQTDPLPGVGGRLFIITKSQQSTRRRSKYLFKKREIILVLDLEQCRKSSF